MNTPVPELERQALEYMKSGEYGTEAVAVNAAIIEQAPRNVSAWVRMGRCHLEQRQWDEAVSALRAALQISPTHTVATNLLNEVRKRRALAPTAVQRTMTGFGAREFALVEALPAADAAAALKPRIEALFDAVNQSSIAAKIVEARHRSGESGTKLFHANSFAANEQAAMWSRSTTGAAGSRSSIWAGSARRRMPPIACGSVWDSICRPPGVKPIVGRARNASSRFSNSSSGRSNEPGSASSDVGWPPTAASFSTATVNPRSTCCPNGPSTGCSTAAIPLRWVGCFVGRWLFLDKPDDAKILGDRAKLATIVDDTFRALFPIWLGCYSG